MSKLLLLLLFAFVIFRARRNPHGGEIVELKCVSSFGQFWHCLFIDSRLQVDNKNSPKICDMIIQIMQHDRGPTLARDSSVDVDSAERFRAESPSCFVTGLPAKREATASHTSNTGTSIMVTKKKPRDTVYRNLRVSKHNKQQV